MSQEFRGLLKKVGSGHHTSEDLSRAEAYTATCMMLLQEATPAQIGAFMIAHRIKRPTGEELAGMLDAYDELGPKIPALATPQPVLVMNNPYDGRSRTAPIGVLTCLVLATAGLSVLQHGGDRMPTKAGVPLIELWQGLGVRWEMLALDQVRSTLERSQLGFVYLPNHFPLAQGLVEYRDQIGRRPPFSTLELMWNPYAGETLLVCGFVHPPTENMFRGAFEIRGTPRFIAVKGLEGSCDLPRDRTAIIGIQLPDAEFERLHLVPREFGFAAKEVPLDTSEALLTDMKSVLSGEPSDLLQATLWNAGFYLWRGGVVPTLEAGFAHTEKLLKQGKVAQKLGHLIETLNSTQSVVSR